MIPLKRTASLFVPPNGVTSAGALGLLGLASKQGALARGAPPIARQGAALAYDAVTRDGDGDGVGRAGAGDGTNSGRRADLPCKLAIGDAASRRDLAQRAPDTFLERSALDIERKIEPEGVLAGAFLMAVAAWPLAGVLFKWLTEKGKA